MAPPTGDDGLRCFICRKEVPARADNPAFPFCSARCQLVDLGHWLSGDYRIPTDAQPEDESEGEMGGVGSGSGSEGS